MYYLLQKYAVESVRHLMERSAGSCLLFGAMPAFYYLFDNIFTTYTIFGYRLTCCYTVHAIYYIYILFCVCPPLLC